MGCSPRTPASSRTWPGPAPRRAARAHDRRPAAAAARGTGSAVEPIADLRSRGTSWNDASRARSHGHRRDDRHRAGSRRPPRPPEGATVAVKPPSQQVADMLGESRPAARASRRRRHAPSGPGTAMVQAAADAEAPASTTWCRNAAHSTVHEVGPDNRRGLRQTVPRRTSGHLGGIRTEDAEQMIRKGTGGDLLRELDPRASARRPAYCAPQAPSAPGRGAGLRPRRAPASG